MYALPALEWLKKKWGYLHLETTTRGHELYQHHPAFDRISSVDLSKWKADEWGKMADMRWHLLQNEIHWDHAVNFWHCLESEAIVEEHEVGWHWERERRQAEFGGKNFYDQHLIRAGMPIPKDPAKFDCGTIWFDDDTAEWMRYFKHKYRDRFIVAMPLAGSTGQKCPHDFLRKVAFRIEKEIPETLVVQLGWLEEQPFQFALKKKGNAIWAAHSYPYLQSLSVCKIADYVVGPETSLLVGAGIFGTPKTMLATASGYQQATKYHRNDFSTQSTAPCSPCYRAIYNQNICNLGHGTLGSQQVCNFQFDIEKVMEGVHFAYKMRGMRRGVESLHGRSFGSLPELRPLLHQEGTQPGEVRRILPRQLPATGRTAARKAHQPGALVPCAEVYIEHAPRKDSGLGVR
jgi:ADP-heptose:LPS heptosyltransferase